MDYIRPLNNSNGPTLSAQRIARIARSIDAKSYLEIGAGTGATFNSLQFETKVAVDPDIQFDVDQFKQDGASFIPTTSDEYFSKHATAQKFDIIFLDGLHTFQQTFRDFCNSLTSAHDRTVWLIDDVLPNDVFSSWPDAGEALEFRRRAGAASDMWHGDVFKLMFVIHDFFATLSYVTVTDPSPPQAIVWKTARPAFSPILRSLESIERLSYFDLLKNIHILNPKTEPEAFDIFEAKTPFDASQPHPISRPPSREKPAAAVLASPVRQSAPAAKRPPAGGPARAIHEAKRSNGRLKFYNPPPEKLDANLIENIAIEARTYRNAFVSKFETVKSIDGTPFKSAAEWYSRGAVYTEQGVMVPEITRFSKIRPSKLDMTETIDGARVAAAQRISGPCIYLGRLHGHFGHFLLESLARAWVLLQVDKEVRLVFHFGLFASHKGPLDWSKVRLPQFVHDVFDLLGMDMDRLVLANRDLSFDELIVPNAQFWIEDIAGPGMPIIYDHLREQVMRKLPAPLKARDKVYLTRTQLDKGQSHKLQKTVSNEHELELLFGQYGFDVVAPEKMPFHEQIMMFANASQIAGTTGSALHMALFNNRPDTKLIAVDSRYCRTQYIIDAIRGFDAHHILYVQGRDGDGSHIINTQAVAQTLKEIL